MRRLSTTNKELNSLPELVTAHGRTEEEVAFDAAVVAFFVSAGDLLGVPRSVSAIYGVVFASPAPLSFAAIEARLEFSKGSISQGLRVLRDVGAVKEVSTAGDRTELFTPEVEMRSLMQQFLEQRLRKQLDEGKTQLTSLAGMVAKMPKTSRDPLNQRLAKMRQWNDRTRALVPMITTFLKLSRIS